MKSSCAMKGAVLAVVVLLLGAGGALGQPRGVTLRLGWVSELGYQHTLGPGFIEGGVGVPWMAACPMVTASYNYVPWTFRNDAGGAFEPFVGGGVQVGTFIYYCGASRYEVYPVAGAVVPIGFQFRTARHFLFALSWRPMLGAFFGDVRPVWYKEGLYDGGLTLGYAF